MENTVEPAGEIAAAEIVQTRLDIRTLKGLAAAEGWVLGALLAQPLLYDKFRHDLSLSIFQTLTSLAANLIEYLENHPELSEITLADIINHLQELPDAAEGAELSRQAIELERKIADWVEPANFSPNHTKLLQHLTQDRGLSLESLARDSLMELQKARGTTDPQVEADFAEPAADNPTAPPQIDINADFLKQIQEASRRNASGGNRRVVG